MIDKLLNDFLTALDGKVTPDDMKAACEALRSCMRDYTVEQAKHELMLYEGLPKEFEIYLVAKKIEGRSPGTLLLYKIRLQDMFDTIQKNVVDITANDIRIYLYQLQQKRHVSDRTLDGCRLILNGFFKWCWEEGYISRNPCSSIRPIHYESKPRQPLSDLEMEILRRGCKTSRDSAIIELLYSTGCRCNELSNLNRCDVDFESRQVRLFGKGKKHRLSYLSARALIALQEYLRSRTDNNPWLLATLKKPFSRLTNGGIEWVVSSVGRQSGLSGIYPHRIRHTFATNALDKGMEITSLQSLLGHSSVDTTMIYAKINPQHVKDSHSRYIS